jgi:hypothetical protein
MQGVCVLTSHDHLHRNPALMHDPGVSVVHADADLPYASWAPHEIAVAEVEAE